MPPQLECGSCHSEFDLSPGARCPSCGTATASPRLRLLVASALCAGSLAFFLASVPGASPITKLLSLAAVALGAAACTTARREQQPAGKAVAVSALGVAVLLFGGSWSEVKAWIIPPKPPDRTRQTVVPLRGQASPVSAALKEVTEANPDGRVDADKGAVQQDGIRVQIGSVRLGRVRFKNRAANDPLTRRNRLLIEIHVANGSPTHAGHFHSWYEPVADSGNAGAKLTDNLDRSYKPAAFGAGVEVLGVPRPGPLTSGRVTRDLVIFDCSSLEGVQSLNLELPAAAVGGKGTFKFTIPRSMIQTGGGQGKTK